MDQVAVLGNLLLAMLLGAVVGWERELSDKPAGFRTHMLVAGAAALFVAIGDILVAVQVADTGTVRTDPIRIVEAVITGVSFLGAGTIIHMRGSGRVEGLTTGASLLFVAGVGICVGIHQLLLAAGATLLVLLVLVGGRLYEKKYAGQKPALPPE
jgi:putative Mg2+ transporter-C (MgtC) family protein